MIFGLIMISQSLLPRIKLFMINVLSFCGLFDKRLKTVLIKSRHNNTSLMLTTALTFIVVMINNCS